MYQAFLSLAFILPPKFIMSSIEGEEGLGTRLVLTLAQHYKWSSPVLEGAGPQLLGASLH